MTHFACLLAALVSTRSAVPHDFDYQFGSWRVHVSRLLDPGSATPRWAQYEGTHTVSPLWDGRANIGVLEITGPQGSIEGLQLRLYDPSTQRWKLSFASGSNGELQPPSVGRFENGRGTFITSDRIGGRNASERTVTTRLTPSTYRDVISYSIDGGKTWLVLWIASYAKIASH